MTARECTETEAVGGSIHIRLASVEDAPAILAVYEPYISTPITFEETVPSPEEFRSRIAAICEGYPCLVAERDGRVLGYAYAHRQAERAAYGWNAELSVYLAPESRGCGLGRMLYATLIDLVREQGVKAAYALVTVPNAASEHLHATFGFQPMGVQQHAGYTCGAWRDVAWLVLPLAEFEADPKPVIPFPVLAVQQPDLVQAILDRTNVALQS